MMMHVKDLIDVLDRIAPFRLAEDWDNVGLLVGGPNERVVTILVGLDPTMTLLDEAIARGAGTIITHHPLIFHPLSAIRTTTPIGRFLEKALTNRLHVIACHTNLDSACNGVSDALAASFELEKVEPLRARAGGQDPGTGIGRIGNFREALDRDRFLQKVFQVLDLEFVQSAGQLPEKIFRLALCGGSGSDLAESALARGADVYLSAEIKHSTARWAEESGFCIIDGTHFATERPIVKHLAAQLQRTVGLDIRVLSTQIETHPFTLHRQNGSCI